MGDVLESTPALYIEEKNGQRRRIKLTGRALPFRPVEFRSGQRVVVDYYPGSPVGTSTVLGGEQEPSTFAGEWNEKFLGSNGRDTPFALNGAAITTAEGAVKAMDSFRAAGALLEVRWFVEVRRGHIRRFTRRWHNINDVEWSLDFEWISAAEIDATAPVRAATSVSNVAEELDADKTRFVQGITDPPEPIVSVILERISDTLAQVESSVSQIRGAVDNASRQALGPYDATRRALGVLTGAATQSIDLARELTAQPAPYLFAVLGQPPGIEFTPGRRVAAAAFVRSQTRQARVMARKAAIARANLLRSLRSDLLAVYVAREGDDLRDVAKQFYNAPEEWRALLRFNHLTTGELTRGQLVLVPRRSEASNGTGEM